MVAHMTVCDFLGGSLLMMTEALAYGCQINYSFCNLLAHRTKCQPRAHIKKRYHSLGHEHHNEHHQKEKSIAVSAKRLIDEQDIQKRSVSNVVAH